MFLQTNSQTVSYRDRHKGDRGKKDIERERQGQIQRQKEIEREKRERKREAEIERQGQIYS